MRRSLAVVALTALPAPGATADAHQGNPNFSSTIRGVTPRVAGLHVQVLNGDDRLELLNTTGRTVVVDGYSGEPYARIAADGTVQINRNSPAYYLNDDRFGAVTVPDSADAKATPRWQAVDKTGRFQWHDHRIHWMSKVLPVQVKDKSKRTKVFDWTVPVRIDGQGGRIAGTLTWVPKPGGGPPTTAIAAMAALVLGGGAGGGGDRRRPRGG